MIASCSIFINVHRQIRNIAPGRSWAYFKQEGKVLLSKKVSRTSEKNHGKLP